MVLATGGGVYTVQLDGGTEVQASLRGRLKQEGGPVVIGDRVALSSEDAAWTIESVEARGNELVRRGRSGRSPKVLAANLDRVFAVLALEEPAATPEVIDRLLVLIEASGIRPMLVLNKLDLPGAPESARRLESLYGSVGYRTLVVSVVDGDGLEALEAEMRVGSSALIGPSGVGKSSLLNAIDPELALRTGALSGKGGRGRHTTVASRLIPLSRGGLVADTPGFSDIALWGIPAEEVAGCFPELAAPSERCRFRSCAHAGEPDCGVRAAVDAGEVPRSRYESYLKLREEASAGRS